MIITDNLQYYTETRLISFRQTTFSPDYGKTFNPDNIIITLRGTSFNLDYEGTATNSGCLLHTYILHPDYEQKTFSPDYDYYTDNLHKVH